MPNANVFTSEFVFDDTDPPGYRSGVAHITRLVGAADNAVKVFQIPPGQSICPYHYEYEEEWLLILEGEVIVFPAGPQGAHKVTNRGIEPALALMWSSAREPAVAVYPDSDKIGVWTGNESDNVMLRRADGHVDYFADEA